MAFVPTPNGARIVINWLKGTETVSYVFYAVKDGYDYTAQQDLATIVDNVHDATTKALFAPQITYLNTTVYDARESDGAIAVNNTRTGPGTSGTEVGPLNVAVCVTMRTAGRGRSSRGRKYITGFSEGHLVSGEWTSQAGVNARAYVDEILAAIQSVGWLPVIRSIQQDGVHLTTAVTRAIVSTTVRSTKVATQRRRVDRP
jgi:hypothetical protein